MAKKPSIVESKEITDTFKASNNCRFVQSINKTNDENGDVRYYVTNELYGQHMFDLRSSTLE